MIQHYQHIFSELTNAQIILLIVFGVVVLIRLFYLFVFTASVVFSDRKKTVSNSGNKISLLITLRNEEENIRENLPAILEINRDDFEMLVVDDYSQDNSLSLLGLFKQRYQHLKFSMLSQETRYSVKLAQNIALKMAINSWMLVTPVTARKLNERWLQSFIEKTDAINTNVLVGYSNIEASKGMYNTLFRVENFFQQIKSFGFIRNNIPFVYCEDNVAFKKENYFALGGYGKNIKEPYANLELIINSFIRRKNTVLNFSEDALLYKSEGTTKSVFLELLKKSYRIEKQLPIWKQLAILVSSLFPLLFPFVLGACLVFCFALWPLIIIALAVFVLAWVLIIKITTNRLNERKIFIPSLAYGLVMPFLKLFFRWGFSRQNAKQKWRHRV